MGIKTMRRKKVDDSLDKSVRQYLVGNLKESQHLKHVQDEDVEVGVSKYKNFTFDNPHFHKRATEYQIILSGYSEIMDVDTKEVIFLNEGDFFVVEKNTEYAQKSSLGTKLLFFKYSDRNNKRAIEVDNDILSWLNKEI